MKKETTKRIGLLLALVLAASLILSAAVAADYGGRTGTLHAYQERYYNFAAGDWTGAQNEKMVAIARAQLGKHGYDLGYTEAWSGDFVCDVARLAGVSQDQIPWGNGVVSSYVPAMCAEMKRLGVQEVPVAEARPGDIVMFDFSRTANDAPAVSYSLSHVAIVSGYNPSTRSLTYIGGNQGNNVGPSSREVTEEHINTTRYSYIAYVFRPAYKTAEDAEPEAPQPVHVTIHVDGAGTVTGEGDYLRGSQVTMTASPIGDAKFLGWYSARGTLLSTNPVCTILVQNDTNITAKFEAGTTLAITASRSGMAIGAGVYSPGSEVTITAIPNEGQAFDGWYDVSGVKQSEALEYRIRLDTDVRLYAMFSGDRFVDIPGDAWYAPTVMEAAERGLTGGVAPFLFDGSAPYSRAMAATMLWRLQRSLPVNQKPAPEESDAETAQVKGDPEETEPADSEVLPTAAEPADSAEEPAAAEPADPAEEPVIVPAPEFTGFPDVESGAWYEDAVGWAYSTGVAGGRDDGTFGPNQNVTRQEFFTMVMRYLSRLGYQVEPAELPYADAALVADYALEPVGQAQALGLITGEYGYLRPNETLNRSEGAAVLVRVARLIEAAPPVTITYEPNGGSFQSEASGDGVPTVVREGYTFLGWFTEQEDGTQLTEAQLRLLTQDTTVYAHWEKRTEDPTPVDPGLDPGNSTVSNEPRDYVINTMTGLFHLTDCTHQGRRDMLLPYYGSRQTLLDMGYQPCDDCNP